MARQAGVIVGETVSRECLCPFGVNTMGTNPGVSFLNPRLTSFTPPGSEQRRTAHWNAEFRVSS